MKPDYSKDHYFSPDQTPAKNLESIAPVAMETREEQFPEITTIAKSEEKNLLPWAMALSTLVVVLVGTFVVLGRNAPNSTLRNAYGRAAAAPIEIMERTLAPPSHAGLNFNEQSVPPVPLPPFDDVAAANASDYVLDDASECLPPNLGQASMKVNITFQSSGNVSKVVAIGPDGLSPQILTCVEKAFSKIRIGAFDDKEVVIQKTFVIR